MSESTRTGLGALGAALLLGLLGSLVLRWGPWGVNVPLWVLGLLAAGAALAAWRRVPLHGEGRWLALPAVLFAAAFAWRDSPALLTLDFLALAVALGLVAARSRAGRLYVATLLEYLGGLLLAFVHALGGTIALLAEHIRWAEVPRKGWARPVLAVARGLAIAVPLLVVFGLLFAAADAVFERLVRDTFNWSFRDVVENVFFVFLWAWIAGGLLCQVFFDGLGRAISEVWTGNGTPPGAAAATDPAADGAAATAAPVAPHRPKARGGLGLVEVGIVLGSLNALFLAFVLVQARYLFGGADVVLSSTTLTYAEYARRGFFELVTVAALLLPLLLGADWLVRKDTPGRARFFYALAGLLVLLLFVVMASAVRRMQLYQDAYGLTELRVYTSAFMAWLAAVFGWFALTVLRGRRDRFPFGAVLAGFAAVATLNVLNPDALIVQTNAGRAQTEQPFDARYVSTLSADAIPALVQALPALTSEQQRIVETRLGRAAAQAPTDWRAYNLSRQQAHAAAATYVASSQTAANAPPGR